MICRRSSFVVKKIGSTDFILKGSMIVFINNEKLKMINEECVMNREWRIAAC